MASEERLTWVAYAQAIALVLAACLVRVAANELTGLALPFATFYPPILFAALWGGIGPGIFAILLSAVLAWYWFLPPFASFAIDSTQAANLALFLGCSGLIVWMAYKYRGAVRDLEAEQERRKLFAQEAEHRAKNNMAVAQTIVRQSLKHDPATASAINGRLRSIHETNLLLIQSPQQRSSLADIIDVELKPYGADRYESTGPDVWLGTAQARSVGLIIHELATNAAKHGSLSRPDGRVSVDWKSSDGGVAITWRECGGPPVQPPQNEGFGTDLITNLVKTYDGNFTRQFNSDGFLCEIELPLLPESGRA